LHVNQLSESRVFDDLFHDVLLIAAFVVLISFDLIVPFVGIGLSTCQLNQKIEQGAFKVAFVYDFVYQVLDKVFGITIPQIALDHFRYQDSCFNSIVNHVNKEIEILKQVSLNDWVV
jgi:hypothetical protein